MISKNPNAQIAIPGTNDKPRKDTTTLTKKQESVVKKQKRIEERKKRRNEWQPSDGLRVSGGLLMMVKRASLSYTENQGTMLPGYMDSTQYGGMNWGNKMNPGLPFAFGYQPDRLWLEGKGQDNVMSRDSLFNAPFTQQYSQTLNLTANLEPVKDFKIDLSMNKTFNKGYAELFKDTAGGGSEYAHLNPYETGGFSISYIAINTLFFSASAVFIAGISYKFSQNTDSRSPGSGVPL